METMRIVHADFVADQTVLSQDAARLEDSAPSRDGAGLGNHGNYRGRIRALPPVDPLNHTALIEPVLPLLCNAEQRAAIAPDRTSGRAAGKPAISLRQAASPSFRSRNQAGVELAYDPHALEPAQSALLAAASQGGWPIAADRESLALLTLAQRIAASDIPVLLEGPTGTGKEVLARFIHRSSTCKSGPFVAVNCAAMPEAMLEGLLFGHRKGAFTGAGEAREGLFRAADGGTLLLDEIGELPLALQAKLLRTLQEGEVLPLGATRPIKVDVRIVAATNRTLTREVEDGRFREDLLYRLNVFPLRLPALCERRDDIAPLAFGMLLRHASGALGPAWINDDALALLRAHDWPGNVRELENVVRRALLLAAEEPAIRPAHLVFDEPPSCAAPVAPAPSDASLSDIAFASEADAILRALGAHAGHRGRTARALGISERTLRYRLASMRECGIITAEAQT
ncbi:MAG: sigma 54-interacting transcriptional regulator [Erythrobacter sp.]